MVAYSVIGLVLVLVSFSLWTRLPVSQFMAGPDHGQTLRGILFGLWTLSLPVYFLWEWHAHPTPPASEMAAYQYGHRVVSDVWTAIAAVLGVLFGVRKP